MYLVLYGKQNKIMCYSIVNLHSNPLIYCWVLYLYVYTIHLFLSWAMLSRSELKLFQKHVFFALWVQHGRFHYVSLSLYLPLIIFSPISLPNCMYLVCSTICSLTSMKIVYISIYFNNLTFPLLDACWLKHGNGFGEKKILCVFNACCYAFWSIHEITAYMYKLFFVNHYPFIIQKNLPYITAKIPTKKKVVISYNITQDKNV